MVPRLPLPPPRPRPLPPPRLREFGVVGAVVNNWCGKPLPCKLSGPSDGVGVKADIAVFPSCCTTFSLFPRPLVDLLLVSRPVPCSPFSLPLRLRASDTGAFSLFVEMLGGESARETGFESLKVEVRPSEESASAAARRSSSSFGSMVDAVVVACRRVKLVRR